jgi:hypothetical protein
MLSINASKHLTTPPKRLSQSEVACYLPRCPDLADVACGLTRAGGVGAEARGVGADCASVFGVSLAPSFGLVAALAKTGISRWDRFFIAAPAGGVP